MKHIFMLWKVLMVCLLLANPLASYADFQPSYSTAGFYSLPNTGRTVYDMNPAWRFYKGKIEGAEQKNFDDKKWDIVSLPNGIEYLPVEASGCINYQGEIWYRKHFTPDEAWKNKQLFLHFEAIMGKSKIWVNGKLLKEHFGGFLPVIVDVSSALTLVKIMWSRCGLIIVTILPILPVRRRKHWILLTLAGSIVTVG